MKIKMPANEPRPIPAIYDEYIPGLLSSDFLAIKMLFQPIQKGKCIGLRMLNARPSKNDDFIMGNDCEFIPGISALPAEIKFEIAKKTSNAIAGGSK
jgi:hypothetical protein